MYARWISLEHRFRDISWLLGEVFQRSVLVLNSTDEELPKGSIILASLEDKLNIPIVRWNTEVAFRFVSTMETKKTATNLQKNGGFSFNYWSRETSTSYVALKNG